MLQDFIFQTPASNWFLRLIEQIKFFFVKGKSRNEKNYYLIN
jgi:hypothetical protein